MFNGLRNTAAILGSMTPGDSRRAFQSHRDATDQRLAKGEDAAHPDAMGYGMVLNARGNVYGDVRAVDRATKARRRAKNKAARVARRARR